MWDPGSMVLMNSMSLSTFYAGLLDQKSGGVRQQVEGQKVLSQSQQPVTARKLRDSLLKMSEEKYKRARSTINQIAKLLSHVMEDSDEDNGSSTPAIPQVKKSTATGKTQSVTLPKLRPIVWVHRSK